MNKLEHHIRQPLIFIGILLLAVAVGTAAGLYWDVPGRIQDALHAKEPKATAGRFSCPMHPEIVSAQAGKCPKCGMALTLASEPQSGQAGCGMADHTAQHGCCVKPQAGELKLPPGHPPVPGYSNHADCETPGGAGTGGNPAK